MKTFYKVSDKVNADTEMLFKVTEMARVQVYIAAITVLHIWCFIVESMIAKYKRDDNSSGCKPHNIRHGHVMIGTSPSRFYPREQHVLCSCPSLQLNLSTTMNTMNSQQKLGLDSYILKRLCSYFTITEQSNIREIKRLAAITCC